MTTRLRILAFALVVTSSASLFAQKDSPQSDAPALNRVDQAIADEIAQRFGGDRTKFLEHLRAQGKTVRDYRRELEGRLPPDGAVATQADANEAVHVRLIQLTRKEGQSDDTLLGQANVILARLKAGESFAALAKEFSGDARAAKGGDWGWQRRNDFKKEFADIAFSLKKGDASAPILRPEGCFLLYLEDRR